MPFTLDLEQGKLIAVFVNGNTIDGGVFVDEKKKLPQADITKFLRLDEDEETTFFPAFPNTAGMNHRVLIMGLSGSGKSTVAGKVLDEMTALNPKPIVIISFVDEDEALDRDHSGITPIRINVHSEEFIDLPLDFFTGCVVIFDDVEKSRNTQLVKKIIGLRDEVMDRGRHLNIDIISITHDILGGTLNKTLKTEFTSCFLFPQYNQAHQTDTFLKKYIGMNSSQVEEIRNLNSRWVFLNRAMPRFYISQYQIKLLL